MRSWDMRRRDMRRRDMRRRDIRRRDMRKRDMRRRWRVGWAMTGVESVADRADGGRRVEGCISWIPAA